MMVILASASLICENKKSSNKMSPQWALNPVPQPFRSNALLVFFTITQSWQCWHYCQLCVVIYLQFSSLFATNDASKCEIRNQGIHQDYISRLHASSAQLIFNGRAKTKLAMLAFLCCGEFVKNSTVSAVEACAAWDILKSSFVPAQLEYSMYGLSPLK